MSDELWTIDRFEADRVVLERPDQSTVVLPRWLVPDAVHEGDVLRVHLSGGATERTWAVARDDGATRERARRIEERARALRGADPGGDIEL